MARKYTLGQNVRIDVDDTQAGYPPYKSFLTYHGKTGVVTAVPDRAGADADDPQVYEVRLNMSGNVILTVPEDVLVATER
jgi:ribosomal protein L21E